MQPSKFKNQSASKQNNQNIKKTQDDDSENINEMDEGFDLHIKSKNFEPKSKFHIIKYKNFLIFLIFFLEAMIMS